MLPMLVLLQDGKEQRLGELVEALAGKFDLSTDERQQLLPSGQGTIVGNRVGWARTYLKKGGLIESSRRGYVTISARGLKVLATKPERIDVKFLEQFPEFVAFRDLRHDPSTISSAAIVSSPSHAGRSVGWRVSAASNGS